MRLSDAHIKNFKSIYEKRFGTSLKEEEVHEKASRLLRLMEIIYVPMRHSEIEAVEARNRELGIAKSPTTRTSGNTYKLNTEEPNMLPLA